MLVDVKNVTNVVTGGKAPGAGGGRAVGGCFTAVEASPLLCCFRGLNTSCRGQEKEAQVLSDLLLLTGEPCSVQVWFTWSCC